MIKYDMTEVLDYIDDMESQYGKSCDLCEYIDEFGHCENGHRTKTIIMELGPNPEIIVRKKGGCPDFKRLVPDNDPEEERIRRQIYNALDCGVQQYGSI